MSFDLFINSVFDMLTAKRISQQSASKVSDFRQAEHAGEELKFVVGAVHD